MADHHHSTDHYKVLILGAGAGGLSVAARLTDWFGDHAIAVIDPSETHYYQPLWTLVGGGVTNKEETARPQQSCIPRYVEWIKDSVTAIDPKARKVTTAQGRSIGYDQLVVALGLKCDWDAIPGLKESLGKNGVVSNYSYEHVDQTWNTIRMFRGGRAIFTHPNTPIKCGGAPQKIMYLADEAFRARAVRDKSEIHFHLPSPCLFAVKKYNDALERVCKRKDIQVHTLEHLTELRPDRREAVFKNIKTGEERVDHYDMIHVTPPMSPPKVVADSLLAGAGGWVEVDKETLQHKRFPEVFSLGDVSDLPTSKTGAAIRKQAPVLAANLIAAARGLPLSERYDGYTSCPLVTGYGKLILAEFNYEKTPSETFPFDQSKERWSMYQLKRHLLPQLYWHGMLKGRA